MSDNIESTREDTKGIFKKESDSSWKGGLSSNIESIKIELGENSRIYQVLSSLFEKAKEQEEKFKKQAEELETIKKDSKEIIVDLKSGAKEFKEKIKEELGIWKFIIAAITVITMIGFITLVIDTFWRRNDDFHKMNLEYNDKVNSLENQSNIIELEKEQMDKKIGEQQIIIEKFEKQHDCLIGKKYWEYEQCFK